MSEPFAPFFARFRRFGDRWFVCNARPSDAQTDAVQLVTEAPEFIGAAFPDRPLPRAAMVAPGTESNRVLLLVDEAGGVTIAACPDAEGMAPLVSELLAASAKLWHQKADGIAKPFQEFLGMSLADWIGVRVGAGWSQVKFRTGLDESLSRGKFPLAIVAHAGDPGLDDALGYLANMNLDVRVLNYEYLVCGRDEVVRPLPPAVEQSGAGDSGPGRDPKSKDDSELRGTQHGHVPEQAAPPPQSGPAVTQRVDMNEHVPTVTMGGSTPVRPFDTLGQKEYEPFPGSNATPKQLEILDRLRALDALGLKRKGFEYFPPRAEGKGAMEGSIVVSIDLDRWPSPGPEEVIVVVRTGPEFLGGYLRIAPGEIEDFLGSLPRVESKEHKGSLLLRAANTHEATQLVNELRALKELSSGG